MNTKSGLYRLKIPHETIEEHGGAKIIHKIYWYLALYINENIVGFYGSDENDYRRYFAKDFEYKSEIGNIENDKLAFEILSPFSEKLMFFKGSYVPDANALNITGWKENTPEQLWFDNEKFEWLDLDYEKLQKDYDAKT